MTGIQTFLPGAFFIKNLAHVHSLHIRKALYLDAHEGQCYSYMAVNHTQD